MVNRYIGYPASTSMGNGEGTLFDDNVLRQSGRTVVPNRSPTSSIDPEQFPTPSQFGDAATRVATTGANRTTQFNSPVPFVGLSLQELTSCHRHLADITLTPQWRESTPTAVIALRRLLPKEPALAYGPLARDCDAFIQLVTTDSCATSGILYRILHQLEQLIQDARSQEASSRRPESSTQRPSKRPRVGDFVGTPQADAVPKSLPATKSTDIAAQQAFIRPNLLDEDLQDRDSLAKLADALAARYKTIPVDPIFENAHQTAVYAVIRGNPTLTNSRLYRKLPHLGHGTIEQATSCVRAKLAFGLNSKTFLRILERVANCDNAAGFSQTLPKVHKLAVSHDQFAVLNSALTRYKRDHQGTMPADRTELRVFAGYLPHNTTAAAAWAACVHSLGYCVSREQALIDWVAQSIDSAGQANQASTSQAGMEPTASESRNSPLPTMEQLVLKNPFKGNTRLLPDLVGLTHDKARRLANATRNKHAFQLPNHDAILDVLAIVETTQTVRAFQRALQDEDLGMNTCAFTDWKIALERYKQTHANKTPSSEKDIEEFSKCIQCSDTAAAVYWAVNREADNYCQPLDMATKEWQAKDPDKFKDLGTAPLPTSVWPRPV